MSENPWAARQPEPTAKATLLALVEGLSEQEAEDALSALEEFGIGTVGSV